MKKTNTKNANLSSFAALGCFVLITTPPASADRPYFGVRVARDADGRIERYSPTYKVKDPGQAQSLAQAIAEDRRIPVVTRATPERPVIHTPAKR